MSDKQPRQLISFDYALKYVLRHKANFAVLEGFLTDLFERKIEVLELLESESNQVERDDKYNRVDLLVKDKQNDIYIIELQYGHQEDYIERMIYGVSKTIIQHMRVGELYTHIKKVISISIVYFQIFDKKDSKDSIFHNSIEITGLNDKKPVGMRSYRYINTEYGEKAELKLYNPFPEYYFIDVSSFHDEIKKPIDEWLFMFRHSYFKKKVRSTNVEQAEEALNYIKLSPEERKIYDELLEGKERHISTIVSAENKGMLKGIRKGLEKGISKGVVQGKNERNKEIARAMKLKGYDVNSISELTGLKVEEILKLDKK